MICFDEGGRRFTYRIVGVAIHDGMVLLHRAGNEPFWALPGGRAEMGETAEQTIRREIQEELATGVEVVRLLWLVENFFDHEGLSYHELGLYFLVRFPAASKPLKQNAFESMDGDTRLHFKWFPIHEQTLFSLPLLPSFLATDLSKLPASVTHIVHRDTMRQT